MHREHPFFRLISLLQQGNSIADGLFRSLSSILIHICLILLTVSEASCTANTTADTSHTLDEVTTPERQGSY